MQELYRNIEMEIRKEYCIPMKVDIHEYVNPRPNWVSMDCVMVFMINPKSSHFIISPHYTMGLTADELSSATYPTEPLFRPDDIREQIINHIKEVGYTKEYIRKLRKQKIDRIRNGT